MIMLLFFFGGGRFPKKCSIFSEISENRTVFSDLKSVRKYLSELRQKYAKIAQKRSFWWSLFFQRNFSFFPKSGPIFGLDPLFGPGGIFLRRTTLNGTKIPRRDTSKYEGIGEKVAFSRKIRSRNFLRKT